MDNALDRQDDATDPLLLKGKPGSASSVQIVVDRLKRLLDIELVALLEAGQGIKVGEWRVLYVLATGGTMQQKQVVQRIAIDQSRASRVMRAMLENGLIAMERNLDDLRNWDCTLTPAGHALFERINPIMEARRDSIDGALSPEELESFLALSNKIAGHVDKMLKTAHPSDPRVPTNRRKT